jgi:hypothetical protein
MPEVASREMTLKMLRDRRERLIRELAALERDGPLSARESLTWRTRLAELEGRIARYAHE